ncbi:hypothetical protein EXN66_Car020426 [Channa argus]|uniref:Uncharacterized protein n=1 Tax=Channa argus TaxID=215402 RepID=A0A6G1QRN2_CHAAH|nr:hypothetical protein EXN66_Car020426 [Channa argus]
MNKGFAVLIGTGSPGCAKGSDAKCNLITKKVLNMSNNGGQNRERRGSRGFIRHIWGHREGSLSIASTSNVAPRAHQRRWSTDFCKCDTSPVIIVRKKKKEPQPPQRSVSLPTANTVYPTSIKRFSCPPTRILISPGQSYSSSTSSSTSSSPPSPTPPHVQTSVITGHDPLGWKLRPISSSSSPRARAKRLSLQIPLPVIFPDAKSSPVSNSQSENAPAVLSPKTKPPVRPKPSRHYHSDSSAFLTSLAPPVTYVVTLEELSGLRLHPLTLSDESDEVFSEENDGQVKLSPHPHKMPPTVPFKTAMARQIAQLISHSRQYHRPSTCKTKKDIYAMVIKPHTIMDHSKLHATKTAGLCLDTRYEGERSTPRFPGREM